MPEEQETGSPEAQYNSLLSRYHTLKGNVVNLQNKGRIDNPKFIEQNERLHNLHISLLEAGSVIGKHQPEVLMDLLLLDKNLSEYGLPDLAVRELPGKRMNFRELMRSGKDVSKEYNSVGVRGWENEPNKYYDVSRGYGKEIGPDEYPEFLKRWLEKPHVFLVYYGYWGGEIWAKGTTPAYGLKMKRLENASKDLGLGVFGMYEPSMVPDMHWPTQLTGLVVPVDRLEEVAVKISKNRDKYWVTEDEAKNSYSPDILAQEETEILREYTGDLESQMLGIRAPASGRWEGWIDLMNVYAELKRRGTDLEEYFRLTQDFFRRHGSPYIPDKISEAAEKLETERGKEEADLLRARLKELLEETINHPMPRR